LFYLPHFDWLVDYYLYERHQRIVHLTVSERDLDEAVSHNPLETSRLLDLLGEYLQTSLLLAFELK